MKTKYHSITKTASRDCACVSAMRPIFSGPLTWTLILSFCLLQFPVAAQVPDPAPPQPERGSENPSTDQTLSGNNNPYGQDIPVFSPGTETVTWNGQTWNVYQNRLFQMRFEKYLNSPEETEKEDLEYQALIRKILDTLAPENHDVRSLDAAWRLLPQASNYSIDINLCDALADAVYSVWLANKEQNRLTRANAELEELRKQHEWNSRMAADDPRLVAESKNKEKNVERRTKRDFRLQPFVQRLAEVNARIVANTTMREYSEVQARIEFQALMVQFFVQRRFEHVLMATRFYRHLFSDGDTRLKVRKETEELFSKSTGMPPTLGVLDTLSNEAMRNVHDGVDAFNFLLEQVELESASKRLAEAFAVGEYLPEIRTLPRKTKRKALEFAQKSNRLLSALDVKDYTEAASLIIELKKIAKDFETVKPLAVIETAKTLSAMHLAKAKNAAVSGDNKTLEEQLSAATMIWPRNPALAEVSSLIFDQADAQQKALADLDQLLSQKNHRQIFEDRIRYIAAAAMFPERQDQLSEVLENMQQIEGAIIRCEEFAKRGDYPGAWEGVERMFKQFPNDIKLNQLRADLAADAAQFVRSIRTAQQLEKKGQVGSSLAWFLKAQNLYPPSEFAKDGIERLVEKVLPESFDE